MSLQEQLDNEKSFSDALVNELLILRQILSEIQITGQDKKRMKDDQHEQYKELTRKIGCLEMEILTLKTKTNPRDWNLYKVIWKLEKFSMVLFNAKHYEKEKPKQLPDPNLICDYCSPPLFTQSYGYTYFIRAFPYGCDAAKGKAMSIFITFIAGPYDDILPWPFKGSFEINLIECDQLKRTRTFEPDEQSLFCFQRPHPNNPNPSYGTTFYISHDELFSPDHQYFKNDSLFLEIKFCH